MLGEQENCLQITRLQFVILSFSQHPGVGCYAGKPKVHSIAFYKLIWSGTQNDLIFCESTGAINERVLTIRALAVGQLVQLFTP